MNLKLHELQIGGLTKKVLFASFKEEKEVTEETVERLHHIHILDRSGSMYSSIGKLVDNVKATLDYMDDGDLITVIWFSGFNECKVLLKGATKSKDLYTLLDTLKSTVGLTCFSEPLKLTNEVIDELKVLCPNFSVTMFTDGCTVTPHSQEEERVRIFKQLEIMRPNILALNTIGYGWYYEEDLLKSMAETSLFGRMIHSENIEEYKEIWNRQYKMISGCIPERVNIRIKDNDGDIVYLTRNNTKLSKGVIEMSYLDKWKNQFFVICPEATEVVNIVHNEELTTYKLDDLKVTKMRKDTAANFLYALAYEYYYAGRTEEALDILMELKDKNMIDRQLNAFTSSERQEFQDSLQKTIFNNSDRDSSAPDNYIPVEDAFCIMDLLKILSSDDNYYVPTKNYNRVGQKVTDNFNLFNSTKTNPGSFKDIVLNSKNLNISLMFTVDGTVKINPRQASKNNLPVEIDSKLFRNHTIIKDGRLNMDTLSCKLTPNTCDILKDKIPMKYTIENDETITTIDLRQLPIINRMYAKDKDPKNLLSVVKKINELKAAAKVYKEYYKVSNENTNVIIDTVEYTPEQLEILKEHGLNAQLQYVGVDNTVAEKDEQDFYMTRSLECTLKGWSSLPKLSDVFTKKETGKKMNEPTACMSDVIDEISAGSDLKSSIDNIKDEVLRLSLDLNTLKMAKVLTGSWWEDLELDTKGNYIFDNLIIKAKYEKKYF